MIRTYHLPTAPDGEPGEPGHAGEPGGAGGRGGAGGAGEPGGRGGEGGAGGRGGDAETTLSDLRQTVERRQGRNQVINYVTAGILLFLTGWFLLAWWQGQQAIKIESIEISNVEVLSESELCPGETLVIAYDLRVSGLGEIIFGDSVYHGEHPVKFNTTSSLIVAGSRTLRTENQWMIPPRPDRAIDGRREWIAGSYTRLISVAPSNSYVSRFTPPAILEAPFEIRSDCE